MVNGWHRFHSATDDTKHIGFTRNGRAIRFHNRTTRPYENCYNFVKIDRSDTEKTTREINGVCILSIIMLSIVLLTILSDIFSVIFNVEYLFFILFP